MFSFLGWHQTCYRKMADVSLELGLLAKKGAFMLNLIPAGQVIAGTLPRAKDSAHGTS